MGDASSDSTAAIDATDADANETGTGRRKRWLVYAADDRVHEQTELFAINLETLERTMVNAPLSASNEEDVRAPTFSPDGKTLVFGINGRNQSRLAFVDASGEKLGAPRTIAIPSYVVSLSWSPDSKQIIYSSGEEVYAITPNRPPRKVANDGVLPIFVSNTLAAFPSRASTEAFAVEVNEGEPGAVVPVALPAGPSSGGTVLTHAWQTPRGPELFVARSKADFLAVEFFTGDPAQPTKFGQARLNWGSGSPRGGLFIYNDGTETLVKDHHGNKVFSQTGLHGFYGWSGDGSRVAFASVRTLYTLRIAAPSEPEVIALPQFYAMGDLSASGRWIGVAGIDSAYVVDTAVRPSRVHRVSGDPDHPEQRIWSVRIDSRERAAYFVKTGKNFRQNQLVRVDLAAFGRVTLSASTPDGVRDGSGFWISPDASRVAFTTGGPSQALELHVADVTTSPPVVRLVSVPRHCVFDPRNPEPSDLCSSVGDVVFQP